MCCTQSKYAKCALPELCAAYGSQGLDDLIGWAQPVDLDLAGREVANHGLEALGGAEVRVAYSRTVDDYRY